METKKMSPELENAILKRLDAEIAEEKEKARKNAWKANAFRKN